MGDDETETVAEGGVTDRCTHCGQRIWGEDFEDFVTRYNDHLRDDHDKPDRA